MTRMMKTLLFLSTLTFAVDAYWLMGVGSLETVRQDPIVAPGSGPSAHVHNIFGGSNFPTLSTSDLQQSSCTTASINEDKSNYWAPLMYWVAKNGSVTSVEGNAVVYYLFDSPLPKNFVVFPDDFRMLSGNTDLRTYNASSFAQQAVTFICLDFNGVSTRYNQLPPQGCPSGIRSQINFPSCWNGKDLDSPNHESHVAFPSQGPDQGTCDDPAYPYTLPRIFMEVYWNTGGFYTNGEEPMNSTQPFVFANGDETGYGYHADFVNGWKDGTLASATQNCGCTSAGFGDISCCVNMGIFTAVESNAPQCIGKPAINEQVLGTLPQLPGNNPLTGFGATVAPPPAGPSTPSPANLAASPPTSSPSVPSSSSPSAANPASDHPPTSSPPSQPPQAHPPSASSPAPKSSAPFGSCPPCAAQVTKTVTVTVTATSSYPPQSSSSANPDDDCCDTESPAPSPTTPPRSRRQSGSLRARHNFGRRLYESSF